MKFMGALSLLVTLVLSSGCGSFLAAIDSNPIEDDPGERTLGAKIDDESIETRAVVNLAAADEALEAANISVISYNGYVLIVGQVPTEELKKLASDELRKFRKVRRIYNELEVRGNSSAMTRSSDTWLTTKIKSGMLADSSVEASRVKIVTENGVVYLMGLLSHAEAKRVSDSARGNSGVQKVVALFEYID